MIRCPRLQRSAVESTVGLPGRRLAPLQQRERLVQLPGRQLPDYASTRYSFFGNGEFHVSDYARVYSQASFVNRQSSILLAPEPLFTINSGLTVSATNAFNPFGKDLTDVRRRLVELSGRSNGFDLDTIRLVAGMDGTMPESFGPFHGWYWDASFNFGRGSGLTTYFGSLNTQLTQNGLGPSAGGNASGGGCSDSGLHTGRPVPRGRDDHAGHGHHAGPLQGHQPGLEPAGRHRSEPER